MLYRITLAYDGTDFQGWQAQAGAARTVQGVLEQALAKLAGDARVAVAGAGRTDTGVHALGQVASFELPRVMPAPALQRALNGILPADVRVLEAAPAPDGFHARRSAICKLYRYTLDHTPVQLPTRRRSATHVPGALDRARFGAAAGLFLGCHDFASLASSGSSVTTTTRTITRSQVTQDGDTLLYEVEADGFLRKMVRSIVGGMLAVGQGHCELAQLQAALQRHDRRAWPAPAPAHGLCLVRVDYPQTL